MALTNVNLLLSTQGEINVTGQPVRASGSTRAVGSLYTVSIHPSGDFQGRIYIEGTLATNPSEEDWFTIVLPDETTPYIEFEGSEGVVGKSFKGSFSWIRARQDRDYLALEGLTSQQLGAYGYIDRIVLNMGTWDAEQTLTSSGPSFTSVESVKGSNLGTGAKLYANSVGQSHVLLNFRSLTQGNGITITEDSQTVTISANGNAGGGGAANFVDLLDTPTEIVANAVVIGQQFGALNFSPSANTVNDVLTFTANGVVWKPLPTPATPTIAVRDENILVSTATELNFVGDGVQVVNDGAGKAKVLIGQADPNAAPSGFEYVEFQYTAGASGNFNSGDVLVSKSAGVTINILDATNCIVEYTFSSRPFPPSSIALMGQAYATNEFNFANVTPSIGTRKIKSGGTAAAPDILGSFSGPITLQTRMTDTGASAGAGQRAKVIIVFRF
jgi:hypothetical protein